MELLKHFSNDLPKQISEEMAEVTFIWFAGGIPEEITKGVPKEKVKFKVNSKVIARSIS